MVHHEMYPLSDLIVKFTSEFVYQKKNQVVFQI